MLVFSVRLWGTLHFRWLGGDDKVLGFLERHCNLCGDMIDCGCGLSFCAWY